MTLVKRGVNWQLDEKDTTRISLSIDRFRLINVSAIKEEKMSSVKDLSRLILVVLVAFLSLSETAESPANQTSSNSPLNQTVTRTSTLSPRPSTTNQTLEHNAFAKMDRGTVIRGAVVLSGITALILMYAGIKAAL